MGFSKRTSKGETSGRFLFLKWTISGSGYEQQARFRSTMPESAKEVSFQGAALQEVMMAKVPPFPARYVCVKCGYEHR